MDHVIRISRTHDALTPLLGSVPLQLLAYPIAVLRGTNPDQPRNLAKPVTVEGRHWTDPGLLARTKAPPLRRAAAPHRAGSLVLPADW
jgi:hypothetical protein